jgi:hypothetical protein
VYAYVVGSIVTDPLSRAADPPRRSRNASFAGISTSTIWPRNRARVDSAPRSVVAVAANAIARAYSRRYPRFCSK